VLPSARIVATLSSASSGLSRISFEPRDSYSSNYCNVSLVNADGDRPNLTGCAKCVGTMRRNRQVVSARVCMTLISSTLPFSRPFFSSLFTVEIPFLGIWGARSAASSFPRLTYCVCVTWLNFRTHPLICQKM
jgi:hypothetical protein